jgi:hypothetical protein
VVTKDSSCKLIICGFNELLLNHKLDVKQYGRNNTYRR